MLFIISLQIHLFLSDNLGFDFYEEHRHRNLKVKIISLIWIIQAYFIMYILLGQNFQISN